MSQEAPETTEQDQPNPLRSVYTSNLPNILAQLNISLVISTYQAGKVIIIRHDNGAINTHFVTLLNLWVLPLTTPG